MKVTRVVAIVQVSCALTGLFVRAASAQLYQHGTPGCEQCRVGEYNQRVADVIPAGPDNIHNDDNPPCGQGTSVAGVISSALATAARSGAGDINLKAIAGSLSDVARKLNVGGTIGSIITGASPGYAACKPVCAVIPDDARVRGVHIEIERVVDHVGTMEAVNPHDQQHHPDFARVFPPVSKAGLVCVNAYNWAYGFTRKFTLDTYFSSPTTPIEIVP